MMMMMMGAIPLLFPPPFPSPFFSLPPSFPISSLSLFPLGGMGERSELSGQWGPGLRIFMYSSLGIVADENDFPSLNYRLSTNRTHSITIVTYTGVKC